jgi:vesicle-associated membrane protein 7
MNIKYVFIGNSQTVKEIGEYPSKGKESWSKDCKQIFEKYCKSNSAKYEQRNLVVGQDGNYCFIIMPSNIFYLVLAEADYPERQVFALVDELHRDSIYLLTDEKGELNKIGRTSLKNIAESYQKNKDNIAKLKNDVDDIQIEMKNNIKKAIANVEDVQALDQKALKIKDSSHAFKKNAGELKRITCWQNCKWTIILVLLIIGVLLIIIVPIAISASKGDSTTTTQPQVVNQPANTGTTTNTQNP